MMVQNILSNLPNKYFKGLTLKFSCRVPNILEMQKKATKEGSKRALASPRLAIKVRYVSRYTGINLTKWNRKLRLICIMFKPKKRVAKSALHYKYLQRFTK